MRYTNRMRGYSLIELMIVIVILGILASVILPIYREHVRESRRSEARAAIEEIRNLEYEFFGNTKRYGSIAELGYPAQTPGNHYQLAINSSAQRFSATATAINNQLSDLNCRVFTLTSVDSLISYNSGGTQTIDCW